MRPPRHHETLPSLASSRDVAAAARSAFDAWDAHVAVLDTQGRIVLVNTAWERFAQANGGHDVSEGVDYFAVCEAAAAVDSDAAATLAGLRSLLAGDLPSLTLEYPCHGPDERRWFRLRAQLLAGEAARRLIVIHEDVTVQRRVQEEVVGRSLLIDEVDAAVIATDLEGRVTLWSRGAEHLYGWTQAQARGSSLHAVTRSAEPDPGTRLPTTAALLGRGTWEGESTAVRADGSSVPVHVRTSLVRDPDGVVTGLVGISVDRTEQLAKERELRAITDSIGDGLCTLDPAGLVTYVNPKGQRLLRSSLPELAGGSFFHWLHDADGPPSPAFLSSSTRARPVTCQLVRRDGTELAIEYVATALSSDTGSSSSGWVVVFRDVSARRAREAELARQVEDVVWLERIRNALDHGGFVLHAQPIVEIASGRTVQHELLLRMRDPEDPDVLVAPGRFLPAAESLGVAPGIDRWVLARSLAFAAGGHPVEINLSATSLDDAALPHLIEQLLRETGADPADVVFEITETALLENDVTARYFADRMHELGCRLALDDFGTGYGGFTYLKNFPLDFLKIDIKFVRDAVTNPRSRHIIEAIVTLAQAFGLETVAEGIEDDATMALMQTLHVDFAQGYLLGRPVPAESVFGPAQEYPERRYG